MLVEAPEGVQATERIVTFLPSSPVETLTLRWLQEALLGHPLLPLTPSLHGEGLWRQCGQQLQGGRSRSGGSRRRADAGRRLGDVLADVCWWRAGGDSIQAVGWWWRVGRGGERWAEGGGGLGICRGAGVLERLDISQRVEVGQDRADLLLQAEGGLHGWVRGAGRPDAELGDGGLDGADGHVTTEDNILLGLLSRVRLQREKEGNVEERRERSALTTAAVTALLRVN